MFAQQTEGVARQWSSFNDYSGLQPVRFNTVWDIYYEDILVEVNSMIADASEAFLGIESVSSDSYRIINLKRTVYVGECPGVRNKTTEGIKINQIFLQHLSKYFNEQIDKI